MEPSFLNHQLMGSSMMVRFANIILNKKARRNSQGALQIGLCVSGQKLGQLLRRLYSVLLGGRPLNDQVILMIGVNDLLKGTRLGIMEMRLRKIVSLLCRYNKRAIILTLPPIPRLSIEDNFKLIKFNKFVMKMGGQDAVRVIDIYGLFLLADGAINLDLFERFMGHPSNKKIDMVHWNRHGISLVETHLKTILQNRTSHS